MTRKSQQPSYDVFLSHSAKDREFVVRLAEDLVAAGLRVWLDQWNIRVGDSFAAAIDDAIRACRFLVIVMSPDYFQSAWTTQEWQYGLAKELDAALSEEVGVGKRSGLGDPRQLGPLLSTHRQRRRRHRWHTSDCRAISQTDH